MQFCSRPLHYFPHLIKRQKASNIQRIVVWLILQRMRGSKNHAAIALTIRAIRAMRQGNIKSGQCPHPVIHKRLFGIIFNLFLTTMSSVYHLDRHSTLPRRRPRDHMATYDTHFVFSLGPLGHTMALFGHQGVGAGVNLDWKHSGQ